MGDSRAHVLVVDDDIELSRYVERLLTRRGHRVTCVHLGREALEITQHVRPDLIVLDVELPDRTGFEICKILHARAATAEIPVVMITGARAACDDCAYGLSCGAVEYVAKPFVSDIFLLAVERYLAAGAPRTPR
jgi:DNA-binding response OmpR family regulator